MSDSDDTDILLLIPPDFFLAETSFHEKSSADLMSFSSIDLPSTIKPINSFRSYSNCSSHNNQLIKIDRQIADLERDSVTNKCNLTSNEVANWTAANNSFDTTTGTDYCTMNGTSPVKQLNYSTPKQQHNGQIHNKSLRLDFGVPSQTQDNEKFLLKEIDYYLSDSNSNTLATNNMARNLPTTTMQPTNSVHSLAVETLKRHNSMLQNNYAAKHSQSNSYSTKEPKFEEPPLISLSQIWGPEGETETSTMHEERLRRQHCEREIQTLQTRLLEYQQKISVAMKIDKSKDEAIGRLQETNSSLSKKMEQMEITITNIEIRLKNEKENLHMETLELRQKNKNYENELYQALSMAKSLRERNDSLEVKVETLTKSSNEVRDIHRKQLEDLEIRLSNSKANEMALTDEVKQLKEQKEYLQHDCDKAQKLCTENQKQLDQVQNELDAIKKQKQNSFEKLKEEGNRAETLEKHKKALQQKINLMNEKESNLLKELETQRISLKSYYQNQLEQVIGEKLKEFQQQIDIVEEQLTANAKQRELLIAERAIKQIGMINQKNDQELELINEKHGEEIELYRIQLANASITIKQLQEKLSAYQSKRTDIAERLHDVMETQWQKALEILTSPATDNISATGKKSKLKSIDTKHLDRDRVDGVSSSRLYTNDGNHRKDDEKIENEMFETPTTSRHKKQTVGRSEDVTEKLHAYIDFLLQKSPRDLENLDEILSIPKKSDNCLNLPKNQQNANSNRKDTPFKPRPWK